MKNVQDSSALQDEVEVIELHCANSAILIEIKLEMNVFCCRNYLRS